MEKVFESENINYVKITKELLEDYLTMVNDPKVASKISQKVRFYTHDDEIKWIEMKQINKDIIFSMIEKSTNEFIGNIEIMEINNNIGLLGISITPKKQNKHYGQEGLKRIMEYGYEELNLDGYELNVYIDNPKAIACYEKVGFTKEKIDEEKNSIHMKKLK